MNSQSRSRTTHKNNNKPSLPITIYPRDVAFEQVQTHTCYQIPLFIRNEGKEVQKIRIIEPVTKMFKVKLDQNFTHTLAPGLTIKINVFFSTDKNIERNGFADQIYICGNSFKQAVALKAFPLREKLIVPSIWNMGRLVINRENTVLLPVKNQGKAEGKLRCNAQNSLVNIVTRELSIEGGQIKNIELRVRSKKVGNFQQILLFSNKAKCILKGVFVEESVDILNTEGEKMTLIDLGQVYIGEKIEQPFYILNNSDKMVNCVFKTFSKNIEINDLRMDQQRGNFIIKSQPEEYAQQLKTCYANTQHQKCQVQRFQQFQNKLFIQRIPSASEQKLFQSYANGQSIQQIVEQPIIEALVIKLSNNKNYVKVPIKFISVFPRLKISQTAIELGEIKERVDNIKQITIQSEGERDVQLRYQTSELIKIQAKPILKARSTQKIQITLRAHKPGNISQTLRVNVFEGLWLQVKIFAYCRSSSIRAKKYTNLNSSRDLRKEAPLYRTLISSGSLERTGMSEIFNKTDALADIRTAKLSKIMKEHIESENEPIIHQPSLTFRLTALDNTAKNPFMRKIRKDTNSSKLNQKEVMKLSTPLNSDQLSNIVIKEKAVQFGNMFINCEQMREVRVTNNNEKAIIFEWDTSKNQCLKNTSTSYCIINSFSYKTFKICFCPSSLGAISLPLSYIINKNYIFQTLLTAYVTLINVQISTKSLDFCFPSLDNTFEKTQSLQLTNKSNSILQCQLKFQENKHFYLQNDVVQLTPNSTINVKVIYRPGQEDEIGGQRTDTDKLLVKVVGGAQNTIKCSGLVSEGRVTIKENQIIHNNHLVSTALLGKLTIKNNSKVQTVLKVDLPVELKQIMAFDKETILLNSQQKKQINYTLLCHQGKKINSFLYVNVRAGKTFKIPVQINFVFPQIICNRDVIDFGNIPIMGNNYQQTIVLTNLFKSELKLQFSKKFQNQDYTVQIRQMFKPKTEKSLEFDLKLKKKPTNLRDETKRGLTNQKIFRLMPNIDLCLDIKFIPKKLKQFDVSLPLKLSGTGQFLVEPVNVKLVCCAIQPVVYLQPHFITFDTRIIGEGKSCSVRSFEIRNPHQFDIDWFIEPQQNYKNQCFYLSEQRGKLSAKESVHIEVMFKPQIQGHFFQRLDVVLKQKKVSHISLELQGKAIMPSIKFSCNELLMPLVPLGIQSKSSIVLENHGYDAITITKWKTSSHFQSVQINVNFIQGKLLSLAKKYLKVEVTVISQCPISFTTFLQFYDELGNKYQVPISCTIDCCIMTIYPYLQSQRTMIFLDKKDNTVKMSNKNHLSFEREEGKSGSKVSCEFIKNWINYEINLSIKKFPDCIVESEGQLLYRMVNRMSGMQLLKRFQSNNNEAFHTSLYAYYSQCIRSLKIECAFLNQIRPQFLLPYKYYKAYLNSKNSIVENEVNFQTVSTSAWMTVFYQLVKLYILPFLNDKLVNKFANNTNLAPSSALYSPYEMLVFKFLNAFNNDEPFYDLNDQIKFIQILQSSLEKALGLNLTNSIFSLKIAAVVTTPSLYLSLISKFIFDQLKEYGLCQFLTETDLSCLGSKQLILTLVSFINMLYHYSNPINVCFQASIGDKITKIIDIQNPVSRKAKYRLKLIGSEQFQLDSEEASLSNKGKAQARVSYHCKQNKPLQGKLLLIPVKEDNSSSISQPMAFKLTTSILSKITLKKMEITAYLYEVTNICVEVQLPMDITDVCEFNVSLNEEEEGIKNFYCFNQMNRILKNNHDKIQLKLVPLTLGSKFCRVCYRSSIYGEFNFEITAKIELSANIKQIRLKQLKVNKDETVSISISKENDQLTEALRFLSEHHIKNDFLPATKKTITLNKYSFSIVQSSYISIQEQYCQIPRSALEGKDAIRVDLNCSFGKPFTEYTCTIMLKNQILKDVRLYKLVASVAMKPKIVPLSVRVKAQESATIKIPIKIAPCHCSIENPFEQFTITNFNSTLKQNSQFIGIFNPSWMVQKSVSIVAENYETLQQVIYEISLKADEPAFFDTIKLQGSNVFKKKVKIPINLAIIEELKIQCMSKRVVLQSKAIDGRRKWINATILPMGEQQVSNIKLINNKNGHYFWAALHVSNKKLTQSFNVTLQQKSNLSCRYLFEQLPLGTDYQINCEAVSFLKYEVVNRGGINLIQFVFSSLKEMQINHRLYVMVNNNQYAVNVLCKCPNLPIVVVPQILTFNLAQKSTSLLLVNSCDIRGVYKATIQPSDVFTLQVWQLQVKGRQKKQIKIHFNPLCLQTKYKAVLRFQSDSLPTYEYHLNGISEFNSCEQTFNCLIYNDQQVLTDIYFTNHFAKTEEFIIDKHFQLTPFELVEPTNHQFKLEGGCTKKIIVKSNKCDKSVFKEGALEIKLGERKWKYRLMPIVIKNLTPKKYIWNCKARETYYENIQLPQIVLHSIESPPQISPFLTHTIEEGTNNLKLKYTPLKPLPKQQYQIFLLTDKFKYVINCVVCVSEADFDDTIVIKTKQINEVGCVVFKLTNIKKVSTPFKVYFMKGQPDLTVEAQKSILQGYGRLGTGIKVKFVSSIYNKRVQDELCVQTSEMLWRFKVKAVLSKKIQLR